MAFLLENRFWRAFGRLEFIAHAGGHYSRELHPVSSIMKKCAWQNKLALSALVVGTSIFLPAQSVPPKGSSSPAIVTQAPDPQQLFEDGENALNHGKLDDAERAFRGVLATNPQIAGAYANLGVIAMRRKQWRQALELLHEAQRLAPGVAGIRLNIGLVYYRQNEFQKAIPSFESVVQEAPNAVQPRYLLGLCYFFTEHYADAASTLEPLWPQESDQLNYLYVLGIAAGKVKQSELEQRALTRLVETGQNSPEFHLLMGKAHLNREEYDEAIQELGLAAKGNPNLPYLHFNLGMAYLKKQDFDRAREEFLRDIAIEPGVAYDYDALGVVYFEQQKDGDAEKNLLTALKLNPDLVSSRYELAKVYQREEKYLQALKEIDAAQKGSPDNSSIHYIRGQILQKLGRTQEARAEMQQVAGMDKAARDKRERELEAPVPSPEVTAEPQ